MNKVNIFVSYAKDDYEMVEEIMENVSKSTTINYSEIIYEVNFWWDKNIDPTEYWEQKILTKLMDADVVVCMLSESFFKSDFIRNIELPKALKRHIDSGITILGILLEDCNFADSEIGAFQIIPQENGRVKPITKWKSLPKCFEFINNGIEIAAVLSVNNLPEPLKTTIRRLPPNKRNLSMQQFFSKEETQKENARVNFLQAIEEAKNPKQEVHIRIPKEEKKYLFYFGLIIVIIIILKTFVWKG